MKLENNTKNYKKRYIRMIQDYFGIVFWILRKKRICMSQKKRFYGRK